MVCPAMMEGRAHSWGGHASPWPSRQMTPSADPLMLRGSPKKRVRAFLHRNDRHRSRKCPLEMTMSGDSCIALAQHAKWANVICFVSGLAGTQQHGQKNATESARPGSLAITNEQRRPQPCES